MRVWIDIDNTPHVMIFRPLIPALRNKGHEVRVTARSSRQILDLLDTWRIDHDVIGPAEVSGRIRKAAAILIRALRLLQWARNVRPDVGVSHGSRSHILASYLARVRCVTAYDYEHSSKLLVHSLPDRIIVPAALRSLRVLRQSGTAEKIVYYKGYKEEIYLSDYQPGSMPDVGAAIPSDAIVVVMRPPASHVHYHSQLSRDLFEAALTAALEVHPVRVIIAPRSDDQGLSLSERFGGDQRVIVLRRAVHGLNLIWNADLVVGAGGTMNREAALLGIPTYSILGASIGLIDRSLCASGRLVWVSSVAEAACIPFRKRSQERTSRHCSDAPRHTFIREILGGVTT